MSQLRTVEASGDLPAKRERLPDFLIIGAAKAGTSTLFRHLLRHPHIFGSKPGEPEFFARDEVFNRGFGWYCGLFASAPEGALCVEKSTAYTRYPLYPNAATRIAEHLPNVKLVYLMRHPVDRAYSHYVHRMIRELYPNEPPPYTFEEHLEHEPICLQSSEYMMQLEQYLAHYPRSSLRCLLHDDFLRDPAGTLRRILEFVGVDPDVDLIRNDPIHRMNSQRHHEHRIRCRLMRPLRNMPVIGHLGRRMPAAWRDGVYRAFRGLPIGRKTARLMKPPPMRPETRERLIEHFLEGNRRLEEWLGRDLSHWNR